MMLRGGTLFSGIGAPERAAPSIDWRWAAEIDPFASAVHTERFPNVTNLGDVNLIDPDAIEPVDLIVFGSPCQDFSVAGQRKGMDGERGNLTLIGLRLVAKLRPNWLVFENVPGLLSNWSGEAPGDLAEGEECEADQYSDFAAFLGAVRECGYLGCWRVLDAQYAGVPQRRRRIFFVGYLGDWRPAAAVLFERESLRGDTPPSRGEGQGIAPTIAGSSNGGDANGPGRDVDSADTLISGILRQHPRPGSNSIGQIAYRTSPNSGAWETGDRTGALNTNTDRTSHLISYGIDSDCLDRSGEGAGGTARERSGLGVDCERAYAVKAKRPGAVAFGGNNTAGPVDAATACNAHGGPHGRLDFESETFIAHSLRADGFDASEDGTGRGTPLVAWGIIGGAQQGKNHAYRQHVSGCVQHKGLAATGNEAGTLLQRAMSVRRLTPRECERLQGFPDDWTAIQYRGKPAADGPRYRALGNSMAVPVVGWVLQRIRTFERVMARAA